MAVQAIDGGGADPDQQLVVPGNRPLHLFDTEDVRRPVTVVDNGFHVNTESGTVRARRYRGHPAAQAAASSAVQRAP
jgi:hypothetical protein